MAESEEDMQIWLTFLKAAAGIENPTLRPVGDKNIPIAINSAQLRKSFLEQANSKKDTILHILCRMHLEQLSTSESNELINSDDRLILVTWLIANYMNCNLVNSTGQTPLQLALEHQQIELASVLSVLAGNPELKSLAALSPVVATTRESTAVDVGNTHQMKSILSRAYGTHHTATTVPRNTSNFLQKPPRLRGYHYLSIGFYRMLITQNE